MTLSLKRHNRYCNKTKQQTYHRFFGARTKATSALRTTTHSNEKIKAVVSDGGRLDLVITELPLVTAPTTFIVGSLDTTVIMMNKMA